MKNSPLFSNATILLPLINETMSLEKTFDVIVNSCHLEDLKEFIIIVCERTTPQSLEKASEIKKRARCPVVIYQQKAPFIGGALKEGFSMATGSHVVMMASDLETDPHLVKNLITEAKNKPNAIITVSRWREKESFSGYQPIKLILNFIFQRMVSLLYHSTLTDSTFAFRIFPADLVKNIIWEEAKHPFFLETILKPLRLESSVIEIPGKWIARNEGETQNTFLQNFNYIKTALKIKFSSPKKWTQQH